MPFKDLVASPLLPPPSLPPISFGGEPPSRRRCRTVWPTTYSTRSSPFPHRAAPRWCFSSPPATALPLFTVAGGGSFPGTVFPLWLNPRLEVPAMAGGDLVQARPIRPNPYQLCRERIVERMRVLQELIPISHKVLSMSGLWVAGAVTHVVAGITLSSVEGKVSEFGGRKLVWDKWSSNGREEEVVKLMEDVGAVILFLQSKALCTIPFSIGTTMYQSHHQNEIPTAKPEPNAPS